MAGFDFFGVKNMGGGAGDRNFQVNADGTASICLDPVMVKVVVNGAKATRKSPAKILAEALDAWQEAQFDKRVIAELKRNPPDLTKTISHAEMKKRLGL